MGSYGAVRPAARSPLVRAARARRTWPGRRNGPTTELGPSPTTPPCRTRHRPLISVRGDRSMNVTQRLGADDETARSEASPGSACRRSRRGRPETYDSGLSPDWWVTLASANTLTGHTGCA